MSTDSLYTTTPKIIVFYTKSWCPDCWRTRRIFSHLKVTFLEVDVSNDAQALKFVKQLNHGNESVPTIVFPDGTYLVEPGNSSLTEKLSTFS